MIPALLATFFAVGNVNADRRGAIEISERMFATHITHIAMNPGNYLGRTIKLEGIFREYYMGAFIGDPIYVVFRYFTDGCCTMQVGFEVAWPEGVTKPYPADGLWVQATGVLGVRGVLYLELTSLTVLNRTGAALVRR